MKRSYWPLFLFAFNYACQVSQRSAADTSRISRDDSVILTVGEQQIYKEEFVYFYHKNYGTKPGLYTEQSLREYLGLFTDFKLKVTEALSVGLDRHQAFKREFEGYKKQLSAPYLSDQGVIDQLVKQAYKRSQEEVKAAHILVRVAEDAPPQDTLKALMKIKQIRRQVMAGESFASLAMQYSQDPSVKKNQGDLGYFTALSMVYPFENAAYHTPVGQLSEPVRTKFGYHIIQVKDRIAARGKLRMAHIMVKNNKDTIQAASKIRRAFQALQEGKKWGAVCKQYSEDSFSKNKNGELPVFGPGEVISGFTEAAFRLEKPGYISQPFRTAHGWHIAKLLQKYPIASFEEVKDRLTSRVKSTYRGKHTRQLLIQKLKKKHTIKEFPNRRQWVFTYIDTAVLYGKWQPNTFLGADTVFLQIADQSYTKNHFLNYVKTKQRKQLPSTKRQNYLNTLYEVYVADMLVAYEEAHLEVYYPEYRYLLKEYKEGILVFNLMERQVWNQSQDTAAVNAYFRANRDRYRWGKRVKASIFETVSDSLKTVFINQLPESEAIQDARLRGIYFPPGIFAFDAQIRKNLNELVRKFRQQQSNTIILTLSTNADSLVNANRLYKIRGYLSALGMQDEQINVLLTPALFDEDSVRFSFLGGGKKNLASNLQKADSTARIVEQWFQAGDNIWIDSTGWQPGKYDFFNQGRYYVVLVDAVSTGDLKDLPDTKGQVIADFQRIKEDEWLRGLRAKYNTKINEKAIKKLIAEH